MVQWNHMNHHYITSTKTLLAITKRWKWFKRNEYKANGKSRNGKMEKAKQSKKENQKINWQNHKHEHFN